MRSRGKSLVRLVALVAVLGAGACSTARPEDPAGASTAAAVAAPLPAPTTTVTVPPPPVRTVAESGFGPFATVRGLVLLHPAGRVEHVGFHQSNHEGAQEMAPARTAVRQLVLDSRERLTGPTTAADIVADPTGEIRAPVTGTVKRAGGYVLYCRHRDEYVVIEPDGAPGLEVKLLHITGVLVRAGERVRAGETVVAAHPTQLPFESQVDEHRTVEPAWPHVHLEVVDLAIPNRPNGGGGGGC